MTDTWHVPARRKCAERISKWTEWPSRFANPPLITFYNSFLRAKLLDFEYVARLMPGAAIVAENDSF
jgi:hypothetical protein